MQTDKTPDDPASKRRPGRPPVKGPTARQQEVLDFIRAATLADHRPPSTEEIRRHFQFRSSFAVRTHLMALEKKGLVQITRNIARGITLTDAPDEIPSGVRRVPLLGEAPAGNPIEAIEEAGEHIIVDATMFSRTGLFALRVRGDSMIGAGIHDRDIALIHSGVEAEVGELVLARLNGEVTIKRLCRRRNLLYLHPENPKYPDIFPGDDDDFAVVGTVAGLIRKC